MMVDEETHKKLARRLRATGSVFAELEATLLIEGAASPEQLESDTVRREAGIPLEAILGWVEFCGLRVPIDPGVFVPRRRTEFLVTQAAERTAPGATVVDLCCGCGALGLALAHLRPGIDLYASDIEPAAVANARRNLPPDRVFEGDLFDALPSALRGRIDILLANTPYVPSGDLRMLPPEARLHEPVVALDGGFDGLGIQRRIAEQASQWLAPGGRLFVEVSDEQAPHSVAVFEAEGLTAEVVTTESSDDDDDDSYDATIVIATRR